MDELAPRNPPHHASPTAEPGVCVRVYVLRASAGFLLVDEAVTWRAS